MKDKPVDKYLILLDAIIPGHIMPDERSYEFDNQKQAEKAYSKFKNKGEDYMSEDETIERIRLCKIILDEKI